MNDSNKQAELLNALQVIKKTCDDNKACRDCPLGDNNCNCRLIDTPPKWPNIKENPPELEIWRAFKL